MRLIAAGTIATFLAATTIAAQQPARGRQGGPAARPRRLPRAAISRR